MEDFVVGDVISGLLCLVDVFKDTFDSVVVISGMLWNPVDVFVMELV